MWCLATSLAIPKLEYLQTHKVWWSENVRSDRFLHGESENHTLKAITGLCCPVFEMPRYTLPVAKDNNWKGEKWN